MATTTLQYIKDNTDHVIENWNTLRSDILTFADKRVVEYLVSLDNRIETLYDDLSNHDLLTVEMARANHHRFNNWDLLLYRHRCLSDEDFLYVASHLEKLPLYLNERLPQFTHLMNRFKRE